MKRLLFIIFFFLLSGAITKAKQEHLQRANELFLQGKIELSLKEYNKILEENPNNREALLNAAILYRILGKYGKAIDYLKKIVDLPSYKHDKWTIYLLADTYYNSTQLTNAQELYESLIDIYPDFTEAYFSLARVYFEKREFDKAKELFLKVIDEKPYCATCYAYIGKIYQLQDKINDAIEMYETALKKDFNYCEAYYSLAYLYEKIGDYKKAYKYYNKIFNLDKSDYGAHKKRNQLLAYLPKLNQEKKVTIQQDKLPEVIKWHAKQLEYPKERTAIIQVRVGLGVDRAGKPLKRERMYFQCSDGYRIITKSNNNVIFEGEGNVIYGIKANVEANEEKLILINSQDEKIMEIPESIIIQLHSEENNTIAIYDMAYGIGFPWGRREIREYRGEIEVVPNKEKGLIIVNIVNIEEYLYGVVPSEMPHRWHIEALKAQAVAARTIAVHKLKRKAHKKYGYDLCDDQHCQVYRGVRVEKDSVIKAVNETRGEIITYNNEPIYAIYCSNTGGATQSSSELKYWSHRPYLTGTIEANNISLPTSPLDIEKWIRTAPLTYSYTIGPAYRWIRIVKKEDLERRLNNRYQIGKLIDIIPEKRSRAGNVNQLKIIGSKKEVIIEKEHLIRRLLGLGNIRSTLFVIDKKLGKDGKIESFTIYGGGWGHGVGMSQYGAKGMAERGYNYKEILKHYYKEVEIEKLGY